jgi:predicted Zn finger-like uncharacterized protein
MAEESVEPLVTECPSCQTRFRVTENQLQVAAGRVRCGACLTVFQGVEHLLWDDEPQFETGAEAETALDDLLNELDDDQDPAPSEEDAAADLPDLDAIGMDPISAADEADDEGWSEPANQLYGGHEEPSMLAPEELQRIEQTLSGEDPEDQDRQTDLEVVADKAGTETGDRDEEVVAELPEELQPIQPPTEIEALAEPETELTFGNADDPVEPFVFGEEPVERRWWVSVATAAAVVALVVQVLWFQFETWARDPAIRPLYGGVCQLLGCELPTLRDIESMLAQNLVVRSHPEVANALLVDAIIVNQAAFVQPFPVLELRFTSLNGNLVAGRRFRPEEYLAGELDGATTMQVQTPIHVELAIEDPGDEAVNYFLSFR